MSSKEKSKVSSGANLTERIAKIQQGNEDINALILEYLPFIKSAVYKTTKRHVDDASDEFSVGLLAFNEAIKQYNAGKGQFLSFASWVIRRRVIDHIRKESHIRETTFTDLGQSQLSRLENTAPIESSPIDNPLKLEIDALAQNLKAYDIDFEDLVSVSPKAGKTKRMCKAAIEYMINNPAIITKMMQQKRLPIKVFKENLNIPRKFMDRHRKYIIAVVEILRGDYVYLKEYVAFIEKGSKDESSNSKNTS